MPTINPLLDQLSDQWIEAELSHDPNPLFEGVLWEVAPKYFFRHYTRSVHHRIQNALGFVEDPEDALQAYWLMLSQHWNDVVPYPPLIHQSLHYYARAVVRHALEHAHRKQRQRQRDWRSVEEILLSEVSESDYDPLD